MCTTQPSSSLYLIKVNFSYVRSLLIIRAANNAVALGMPVMASVLAFVVYSLTGHSLQANTIFTSLTLFTLLRMPLMFLRTYFTSHQTPVLI